MTLSVRFLHLLALFCRTSHAFVLSLMSLGYSVCRSLFLRRRVSSDEGGGGWGGALGLVLAAPVWFEPVERRTG